LPAAVITAASFLVPAIKPQISRSVDVFNPSADYLHADHCFFCAHCRGVRKTLPANTFAFIHHTLIHTTTGIVAVTCSAPATSAQALMWRFGNARHERSQRSIRGLEAFPLLTGRGLVARSILDRSNTRREEASSTHITQLQHVIQTGE
jgi:hypothetical protein